MAPDGNSVPDVMAGRRASVGTVMRAGLPAAAAALLAAVALRLTTFSAGMRMVVAFLVFIVVNTILFDRMTGTRRSPGKWALTVGVWIVVALALWWITGL